MFIKGTSSKDKNASKKMREQKREQNRAEREALKAQRERHKVRQRTINYDENGTRIGDDGYPMTKGRIWLHRLYDCYFFYMIVALLVGVAMVMLSLFQGQQISEWELVWTGGTQFRGYSLATVLRVEALYLMFVVVISLFSNMKGMAWMYDRAPERGVKMTIYISSFVSFVYFAVFTYVIGVPDVFSFLTLCMSVLNWKLYRDVKSTRGSLKKAKIAKTVVRGKS